MQVNNLLTNVYPRWFVTRTNMALIFRRWQRLLRREKESRLPPTVRENLYAGCMKPGVLNNYSVISRRLLHIPTWRLIVSGLKNQIGSSLKVDLVVGMLIVYASECLSLRTHYLRGGLIQFYTLLIKKTFAMYMLIDVAKTWTPQIQRKLLVFSIWRFQVTLCRISPTRIDTIANLHLMFPGVVSIHVGAGAAFTPVASFHISELPSLVKRIYRVQSEVLN